MMKKKILFYKDKRIYLRLDCFIDENHMYFQKSYLNRKLFNYEVNFHYLLNRYEITHKVDDVMDEYYIEKDNLLLLFPILFQEYCDNSNVKNIKILLRFYYDLKKKRNYEIV